MLYNRTKPTNTYPVLTSGPHKITKFHKITIFPLLINFLPILYRPTMSKSIENIDIQTLNNIEAYYQSNKH